MKLTKMKKIISYFIVSGHPRAGGLPEFENKINEKIKEGWQPLGHPQFPESSYYYQALVIYEPKNTNPSVSDISSHGAGYCGAD